MIHDYLFTLPRQRGVVLILALLFLFVLTLLVVSLFETALLQNKMVNNLSKREAAFLRAEAALGAAQQMLATKPILGAGIGKDWKYVCAFSTTGCTSDATACYRITATGQASHSTVILQVVYQINTLKNEGKVENTTLSRRSWVESDV
jgi:Tfp pilus assembly protein PilX